MKLKQFIFALVAMLLSFVSPAFAQVAKVGNTEYATIDEAKPVAAKIGEQGYATLTEALEATKTMTGDVTVEIYDKVTFNQPLIGNYTSINFVGKAENAEMYLDVQGYTTATGKKVSFTDLKLSKSEGGFIANAGFMNVAFGIYDVEEVTYNNCTFLNGACASSGKVTFNGCTFKKSWDKYGLWAYGNVDVTVQGSTFADYRGIKMYAENGAAESVEKANLTVKNTNFSAVDNKPAIVLTYGESVVLEDNTYSSTGTFELDLDGNPNGTPVTSDDAPVCVNDNGACGVLVDGKIYTTVAQAAEVATSGSTVTLLHNSAETVALPMGVTLNKNNFEAAGVTVAVPVAKIGDVEYATLAAAVEAAQAGAEIVVVANVADVTIDITKNLTISGDATLNNVGINANGADALTVKGLTFTGNSWINSGTAEALTVSGITATVAPSNTSYTNSRSAFISLGRSEGQELVLTVENSNITVTAAGADAILGWAKITAATITGNVIKGSNDGYFTNADAIKFMSIANGAEFVVNNNEIYSNYNGIVFAQNTTRDNAYSVSADANKFYGGADHIWIEISGGNTVHATFNATSENTVNGNAFTVTDIKYHSGVIKNWTSYAGVDVVTDSNGKVIGGTLASFSNSESVAEGYEIGTNGAVGKASVAEVNGVKYASFAEAAAAAQAGNEIKLLANIEGDITVPANVTLNGNGFAISGGILAEGDITFAGVTTAADFDANVVNTAVNIPAGASLQLTGTARLVIGHGATFNITGTIEDAKTADKATLVPSLKIAAGASITGNGVTFNVKNAYIVANANTTSKNSNANGTLDFNIENSIWEQTGVLAFYVPTSGMDPVVNFELKNSVLTTTSHLVFSVTKGEIVIDNSLVNQGTQRQLENRSTMTIKNGSVVNGAVATSSNAKNPGTVIVENATYAVTGEFSGSDLGTGTLIIKKGANVSAGSITKANIQVDATGMVAGDEINLTANLSKLAGELSVINNDKLEASFVDGKVVLAAKPVAKIGKQGYATLNEAFAAATEGQTITMLDDATPALTSQRAITKAAVIDLGGKTMTLTEDDLYFGTTTFKNGTIVVDPSVKASTAVFWMFANQTLTFDNVKIVATGVTGTYLIGLDGNNSDLNLLNGSEIFVENTTALDLDIICVNASTGNDIKVENSKVNVTNLDGRVFFRGNYTVAGNSEINLEGVTKAGFRIEAGQTLTIKDNAVVNIVGELRDGGIHLTDASANYTKAATATVNATLNEPAKGSNSPAYVGKDANGNVRVWGEGGGNAKESFELKLYAGETLIATSKLNNIGGIINGNVFVTWNFFYPESNDEYWTTTWEEGHPNSVDQPTKLELIIDGTVVATTNAMMCGPDNLNPVKWEELGGVKYICTGLKGEGTEANPYLINNVEELLWFQAKVDEQAADGSTQYAGKYIKLTADIDLAGINWNPIGSMSGDHGSFKGVFDGGDHTISNLNVEQSGNGLGLFARTTGNAVIKNLKLVNVTVKSTDNSNYVGGVVGNAYADTKIEKVHVSGDVHISGRGYIGGIAGHGYVKMDDVSVVANEGGLITSTFWCAGGVLGYAGEGSTDIKNAHVEGLTITSAAGGLGAIVGMAEDNNGTQPISGSDLSAKNVEIKTYTGAYGDSYSNYALGYLCGGNSTSKLTGNLSVEDVTITTSNGVTPEVNDAVASIDGTIYFNLQSAIEVVAEGKKITVLRDVIFTTGANGSTNGISYTRGVSFTLDLNGKTITSNLGNNALRFKIGDGNSVANTEVTIEIKNGKIVSGANNWCAISAATADNSGNKLILNLTDLTIEANKAGDFAVKSWAGAVVNTNNVDVTSNYAGGFYACGGEIVLDENSSVAQKGLHTAPYMSYAFGVSSGTGKMTINGGIYSAVPAATTDADNQGVSHGSSVGGVMSSGGTLIINGGTFSNDNFGDAAPTAPRSLIMADAGAVVTINGGTFNAMAKIVDPTNNTGVASKNAVVTIAGGTYSANPTDAPYNLVKLAENYVAVEDNGVWTVVKAAAKIGEQGYASLEAALAAEGNEVELLVTYEVAAGETKTLDLKGKTINVAYAEGSTTNHIYAIDNKGTLKITGNGTINARGIFNYGAMTLENGTINAIDGNGGYGVRNYAGATFTMNGGTIATTLEDDHQVNNGGYDATTVRVDEGATFTMNGGELNNICDYTFAIDNYGKVTVNGGTVTSVHSTVSNYGTVTINGGSFTCNGLEGVTAHVIVAWDGSTTTINGGTFDGKDNYNGFNVDASKGANVVIKGGKFLSVHSGSLYGDGTITVSGGTFFDKISDQRCELGFQAVDNTEGAYDVIRTGIRETYTIVDGEYTEFNIEKEVKVGTLTYTRTIYEGWNALYVPFEIPVNELANDFEVAYINDMHWVDKNDDFTMQTSEMTMEVIKIKNGTLKANHPYIIRPKNGGEIAMNLVLNNVILHKTSESEKVDVEFSSAYVEYKVSGTYTKAGVDILNNGNDIYIVSGDNFGVMNNAYPLPVFRIFMTVENKEGSPVIIDQSAPIRIRVAGEKDEATGIITPIIEGDVHVNDGTVYDLMGRPVRTPEKGKIYIMNGKKVLF